MVRGDRQEGDNIMRLIAAALAALLVWGCATEPAVAPEPESPATLSDAAFKALWNQAYNANPRPASETYFAALIAREDITPKQRGEAYYGRGALRGIFIREWPQAWPQCSLGDLLKALEYPLTDARAKQTGENIIYQYDRRIYFPEAPAECAPNVDAAAAWLQQNRSRYE